MYSFIHESVESITFDQKAMLLPVSHNQNPADNCISQNDENLCNFKKLQR